MALRPCLSAGLLLQVEGIFKQNTPSTNAHLLLHYILTHFIEIDLAVAMN